MNEKLLQYIWNYKVFSSLNFHDSEGYELEILEFGKWNLDSGPDFLFAKIKHRNLVLAGNIELHVKSSDWIFHRHSGNPEFENVILHAVYEHDLDIAALSDKNIPTLQLKDYISQETIAKYKFLVNESTFIPCEELFSASKIPPLFHEETMLKRLNEKAGKLETELQQYRNDYEAVLFHSLAYAFGLKVNAELFRQLAQSLDFSVVRKVSNSNLQLEALFFGMANWLDEPCDAEMHRWKTEFEFLKNKFRLQNSGVRPKFLRLRPPNFPTIRLSQLANLYHCKQNLFSQVIAAKNPAELYLIFDDIQASEYWDSRFNFGKVSSTSNVKTLSRSFIDLIIINAVLPLKYAYHRHFNENAADEILEFYGNMPAEGNTVVENWKKLGAEVPSALESQSFVHHYHTFCLQKNCLNCSIGLQILK